MTDKQIIIDSVDVSGCVYFCDGYCNKNDVSYKCNLDNKNCYYKQLKRKEQECEDLQKIINEAKNSKLDLKSFLVGEAVQNEYEQQLDQLKADRTEALKQLEFVRTLNTVKEAENRKLSKTLTEIKEIAKNGCYDDCGMPLDELSIILQKISECEGNDE